MIKSVLRLLTMILAFSIGTGVAFLLDSPDVQNVTAGGPTILLEQKPSFEFRNPETNVQSETFSDRHFNGWYGVDRFAGMDEVMLIAVSRDVGDETGQNIKSETDGAVFTTFENDGKEGVYEEVWSEIDSRHVMFRTEKRRGIEYRFEGTFFKNKTVGEQNEKLLRGTLRKFRNGKKVAELRSDFEYYEPHCWH